MACESYEVCRKEPFGISIATFELLPAKGGTNLLQVVDELKTGGAPGGRCSES